MTAARRIKTVFFAGGFAPFGGVGDLQNVATAALGFRTAFVVCSLVLASVASSSSSSDSGCRSECNECAVLCPPPKSCCQGACCATYDESRELPGLTHHTPYAVHSVFFNWTALYFWFIVIFLVVSCVGGCGYWRWRHVRCVSTAHFPGRHRRRCGSHTPIQEQAEGEEEELEGGAHHYHHHNHHHQGIAQDIAGPSYGEAYHHPLRFVPAGSRLRHHQHNHHPPPPPYSEVTSKPDMYPLVQGGLTFKNDPLAFLYATTPLIHTYMPYNAAAMTYLTSPAESNSSLFQSTTTASNCVFPPPYSDGYHAASGSLVSTPGSLLSACTPTDQNCRATYFLSSVSPPMATTPTSMQLLSEVTTPADSLASPTLFRFAFFGDGGGSATDVMEGAARERSRRRGSSGGGSSTLASSSFTRHGEAQLATLVADIQSMTNRVMRHDGDSPTAGQDEDDADVRQEGQSQEDGSVAVSASAISPSEDGDGDDNETGALCRSRSTVSTCSSSGASGRDPRSAEAEAGSDAGAPWTPGGDSQCATVTTCSDTGGSLASVSSGDGRSRRSSSDRPITAAIDNPITCWRLPGQQQVSPRSPPRTLPVALAYVVSSEAGTNTSPMMLCGGNRLADDPGIAVSTTTTAATPSGINYAFTGGGFDPNRIRRQQ